ncbi:hypothetical protein JTB14_032576 [Gonioctena quinquepunctata]|nr:hypothetical protein JTB14_032576 [Gonioctena quinquepunctata]
MYTFVASSSLPHTHVIKYSRSIYRIFVDCALLRSTFRGPFPTRSKLSRNGSKISSTGLIIKKVKLAGQEIITIELQEVEDAAAAEPSPTPPPPAAPQETRPETTPTSTASQRPAPSTSPPNTMTGSINYRDIHVKHEIYVPIDLEMS